MEIRRATAADEFAWDAYVTNHPNGLPYLRFAWKKAIKEAYRFDDYYLLAEKTGKIVGVLPLIDFRLP